MPRLSSLASRPAPPRPPSPCWRRPAAQGAGQGRRRAGDRRQPVPEHAARQGGRHPGDRGEPDRLLPEPGPARVPRGRRAVRPRRVRLPASAENVVVASGAKPFEQYFAEALLDPGDGVLVFSPHFPTYVPNLQRRGARAGPGPARRRARLPAPRRGREATSWRPTRSRAASS